MKWDGRFLPPMLAHTGSEPFDDPGWRFELKWDGWRALVGRTERLCVWSRRGRDLLAEFPDLHEIETVVPPHSLIDGEVVSLGTDGRPDFLALRRRHPPGLRYVAFDMLAADGELLLDRPLSERLRALESLGMPHGRLLGNEGIRAEGRRFYAAAAALGLEGIVAKRLRDPYWPGRRSDGWLKLPVFQRVTLKILSIVPRQEGVSLVLVDPALGAVGQVDAALPPPPGVDWVLVETRGRTSRGHLRHARVIAYGEEEEP